MTRWLTAVMLLLALIPVACKRDEPGPGKAESPAAKVAVTRVAILADDAVNPMRNYQATLLQRLIRTRPHMEVSAVHAKGDASIQIRQVREATSAGAAFIMIFPQDAEKVAPALREALARGVRVLAFSQDLPEDACTSTISTDERQLGRIAGEYVVAALKIKAEAEQRPVPTGRVVMLRTDEESLISRQRSEGFTTALQAAPGVVLVHDAPANWNENDATDRTREALRLQKSFDVIYGQNDFIALGASKTVRAADSAAREAMLVLGTDAVPGKGAGVAMVLDGELDATVYQPPLVDVAWREMQKLLSDPSAAIPKRLRVKPFVITPENASKVQEHGLPMPELE